MRTYLFGLIPMHDDLEAIAEVEWCAPSASECTDFPGGPWTGPSQAGQRIAIPSRLWGAL